ncbi:hypothetical protein DBR06_SOUSAS11410030, partial [Sousa chinensis]
IAGHFEIRDGDHRIKVSNTLKSQLDLTVQEGCQSTVNLVWCDTNRKFLD